MKIQKIVAAGAVIAMLTTAGQVMARGAAEPEPRTVVATHSILGDLVANVAGDTVELQVIVGANQDPHVYEPAPADSIKLRNAALVFENGLQLKGWFDGLYERSGSTARRVVVSDGIHNLLAYDGHGHDDHGHEHDDDHHDDHGHEHDDDHGHEHDDDHGHGHGHGHGHDDDHHHDHDLGDDEPHVWQSVHNAEDMVKVIRDALIETFPEHADTYRANAAAYIEQLEELDDYIKQQAASIPESRRKLVTSHGAFDYFADRYGFTVVGTALGSVTTETRDPSAGEIAALVDEIRALEVPAIFAENIVNRSVIDTIAREAGVRVLYPLYSDALSDADSPAATYLGMMRHNIDLIVDGLAE